MPNFRFGFGMIFLGLGSLLPASASSPQLNIILPRGVQRGHEHVLTFTGARLGDAQEVWFYDPGVSVTNLKVANDENVEVTVRVAEDCRLGEQVAQVRAASGISEFRSVYVGALAQLDEQEPNGSLQEAQSVPRDITVQGVVENEDVDYLAVDCRQGERLTVEIEAMRLGTALFDPSLAILDANRFELATVDDSPLVRQDAIAAIMVPQDGRYYVQVRESSYGGDGNCRYRLHIGRFPRPTAAYPPGGKKDSDIEVTLLGDIAGAVTQRIHVPAENSLRSGIFASDEFGICPSPIPFRVSDLDNQFEQEPNNDFQTTNPIPAPQAINGVIGQPKDADYFKFTAKKGEVLHIECYARRLRSGLDSVLYVYHPDGRAIAGDDDARAPDSYVQFTPPEDGEFVVGIFDQLLRGQADFVYRIEFTTSKPALVMGIPRVEQYSQYRQSLFIPRGNRFATLVSATRENFSGAVVLDLPDLPAGVTVHAQPMADNLNVMPVVLEAAADAPLAGALVPLRGRPADSQLTVIGQYLNRADFVLGPPNQSLYYPCDVNRIPVAVIEALPFQLDIIQPQAPLVRSGAMNLKIVARRQTGFNGPITLQFPFQPPGVGAAYSVTIPENAVEGLYPLNANESAQLGTWPIYVIGSAEHQGPAWASTQLAQLVVAEPYVTAEIQRASCEQGQPAQIHCRLTHRRPFAGTARAELLGLPPHVTCEPIEFTKDTAEFTFKLQTVAESPTGKHTTLFCQFNIPEQNEMVISNAGGTELQIDAPLPATTAEATQVAQAAPPAEQPATAEAPLSRLQKLRLAAQEQGKQP